MWINVLFGCSCQEIVNQSHAHYIYLIIIAFRYKIIQIRSTCIGLLNCPLQCINTPKIVSQSILNQNIDILIYRYISHITIDNTEKVLIVF